jgi:hypothetical protein
LIVFAVALGAKAKHAISRVKKNHLHLCPIVNPPFKKKAVNESTASTKEKPWAASGLPTAVVPERFYRRGGQTPIKKLKKPLKNPS